MLINIIRIMFNNLIRSLIKQLKYLSKYINISIKYLSGSNRFNYINKKLNLIKGIIIQSRFYKIYKLYRKTIKLLTLLNLILVISFSNVQFNIELDYIALLAFISSILTKLTFNFDFYNTYLNLKDIVVNLTKKFYNNIIIKIYNSIYSIPLDPKKFPDSQNSLEEGVLPHSSCCESVGCFAGEGRSNSNYSIEPSKIKETILSDCDINSHPLIKTEASIPSNSPKDLDSIYKQFSDNSKNEGLLNNNRNTIILLLITLGIASYIYWDIKTQSILYSTAVLYYDNIISFFHLDGAAPPSEGGGNDTSSSSSSNSSISSNESSRTTTPSNPKTSILDTTAPILNKEIDVNTLMSKTEIPLDSRILESDGNSLTFKTPDNKLFILERSTSPQGSVNHFKYELDRPNNYSKTEILTIYPKNSS